ncbi:hypothetical protein SprV_0200573600 [Sparganum proliferum]
MANGDVKNESETPFCVKFSSSSSTTTTTPTTAAQAAVSHITNPDTTTDTTPTASDSSDEDQDYTCPHCGLTLTSRIGLVGHLRIHRTETGEPVPGAPTYTHRTRLHCPHCPRTFTQRMGLFGYMRMHESGIDRSTDSSIMSNPTSNSSPCVPTACPATDTDTTDFACPHCPRTFTSRIGLAMMVVRELTARTFSLSPSDKAAMRADRLRKLSEQTNKSELAMHTAMARLTNEGFDEEAVFEALMSSDGDVDKALEMLQRKT